MEESGRKILGGGESTVPVPQSEAGVRRPKGKYEVHEHCFIRGRRASGWRYKFSHSHEGGDVPHQHTDTGPASYTIDKDEWFRATGLRGGGRKKFTAKPSGEQFPRGELEKWQTEFEVIVCPPPKYFKGEGAGISPVARMVLACGMTPKFTDNTGAVS